MTIQASNHYCLFEVDQTLFAVAALQVREICGKPNYASTPGNCHPLAGLWHEGSEFLPILRLPFQNNVRPELETQVLVIHGPQGHWGLLVHQVREVAEIELSHSGAADHSEWSTAMLGMAKWQDNSVRVLQLDAVYRLSEQILKQQWNTQA